MQHEFWLCFVPLFVISLRDLLTLQKVQRQVESGDLGPVPVGVPLIVGRRPC